jgi:hypothetical protein
LATAPFLNSILALAMSGVGLKIATPFALISEILVNSKTISLFNCSIELDKLVFT